MKEMLNTQEFRKSLSRNFMLPLILGVLVSGVFVALILHLVATSKMVAHTHEVIAKANESVKLIVDAETGLRGFVITENEKFLQPYHHAVAALPETLDGLINLVEDNPVEKERIRQISAGYREWSTFASETIDNVRSGRAKRARETIRSERGKMIMDGMRVVFNEIISAEEKLVFERNSESTNFVRTSLLIVIFSSLLVGGIIAFVSRKQLLAVSKSYGSALERMLEQNRDLQEQDWLRAGQTRINEVMRGDLTLAQLAEGALGFFADTLGVRAATFYSQATPGTLALTQSYAISPAELSGIQHIRLKESLVGQAAIDNKIRVIDSLPTDYFQVRSSLGSAKPSKLILFPVASDGEVRAVLELGMFEPVEPRHLKLLEILSEDIGVAVRSALYRIRLQELLEESQRQAEELQAQQEELRVSNEEMEEHTKALKESQTKLETQQAELEQTNSQLCRQSNALEAQNEELVNARQIMEVKARELAQASQYKSQFLANMSHELRTPLNSTLILSQLLVENKSGRLSAEDVDFAQTILSSSNDLLNLINDILDLAKVEAGKIDLRSTEIELEKFALSLEKVFAPITRGKPVEIRSEVLPGTPSTIETDRLRLEQILKNFLSNAVKFTGKGSVSLSIFERQGRVGFAVKDTGIGIPKDKLSLIFEAFQQADGSTSRTYGGTGLGLTISRDLAKMMGGEIEVESTVGTGSTFTLWLPKKMSAGAANPTLSRLPGAVVSEKPSLPKPNTSGSRNAVIAGSGSLLDDRTKLRSGTRLLMIVEDDSIFAKHLIELSHELEFQCLLAPTAEEAIALAIEYIPHAVLLDMQLPDHTGLFVLDRLKENPITRHIPVHIVSGMDYTQAALQMGAVGYLQKPASRDQILGVIKKLESKLSQEMKRVLIVEDNLVQRDAVRRLLAGEGTEVHTVATGAEALDLIQKQTFDCLVVDLTLPDMSGYELLEKISGNPESPPPPVIVYTGHTLSRAEEDRLQRYSRSIIVKGARSPERLLSEVSLFLHQVESSLPPERQQSLRDLRDRELIFDQKTLLIVDDDVRNIFALTSALEPRGAKIVIARNGQQALEQLAAHPGVDLVLMDIMMPIMDGYDAMKNIRNDPKLKKLPIIALTAKAMSDDQEKCIAAGANDYLAKPIDLQKLLSLIRVWIHPNGRT
ncbi:MAG: response regulator [Cryobacterium sp.]|nr:response regulator [Oligoflexia bacterium]